MMLDHGSSSTRNTATHLGESAADPRAALESQLAPLRVKLLRHARFAVHDDSLAEDPVQDTLIAVVEQHTTRRGDASLVTWATAIAAMVPGGNDTLLLNSLPTLAWQAAVARG